MSEDEFKLRMDWWFKTELDDQNYLECNNYSNIYGTIKESKECGYVLASNVVAKTSCNKLFAFNFMLVDKTTKTSYPPLYTFEKWYPINSIHELYFRQHKRHKPLRIVKEEINDKIMFFMCFKGKSTNTIKQNQSIILKKECNICFETNKLFFKSPPFKCSHKLFCLDCCNQMVINNNNCCPLCRAEYKKNRNVLSC